MQFGNAVFVSENTISDDVLLCLRTLFSVPVGTQPLDRDFGISSDMVSKPLDVAENEYSLEVMDKVSKYESRVEVVSVEYTVIDGQIIPHIRFRAADTEEDYE